MKNIKLVLAGLLLVIGFTLPPDLQAQNDVTGGIKTALKTGSSKDLARFFNNTVEIGLDGEKSTYSKTQAEFVVKNFFSKNIPSAFEFDHQGSSDRGQKYAIGTYTSKATAYRVFVVVKQVNGAYVIDNIDFTKK